MNIVVTGGSGFLGRRLLAALQERHSVCMLSRHADAPVPAGVEVAVWHPETGPAPAAALGAADAVIHLAGEPVAQRWTDAARRRILESRVLGTRNLVLGLSRLDGPARTLVSASAIGYYGSRGDEPLTEESRPGRGFLPEVCAAWEHEAAVAERFGARVVRLRIGVVLSPAGGAMARMLPAFRAGAGGRLGTGEQWMSWVHIDDLVRMIEFALSNDVRGAMNATAPEPVTNRDFTRSLASALRRPAVIPVPAFALRLLFGEMSEVLLASQRVLPKAAEEAGYVFRHSRLGPALQALLR
jgi:uncharacterized protein